MMIMIIGLILNRISNFFQKRECFFRLLQKFKFEIYTIFTHWSSSSSLLSRKTWTFILMMMVGIFAYFLWIFFLFAYFYKLSKKLSQKKTRQPFSLIRAVIMILQKKKHETIFTVCLSVCLCIHNHHDNNDNDNEKVYTFYEFFISFNEL